MPAERIIFDPEGDLLLRFAQPAHDQSPKRDEVGAASLVSLTLDSSPKKETHMVVSSKHLMLASPVFKAMLGSTFREGQLLKSEGKLVLDLEDDDPEAFTILLNAIHGRTREMPEKIDLKMLTQLSILADKYQILDAVRHYVSQWTRAILKNIETSPNTAASAILTSLTMCWVMRVKDSFKNISSLAQQHLTCQLTTDTLPIPSFVLDCIEEARQRSISEMLAFIQKIITNFSSGNVVCHSFFDNNFEIKRPVCDAVVLGTLIKSLSAQGKWPLPEPPYDGISLMRLMTQVRDLNILALCDHDVCDEWVTQDSQAHGWAQKLKDETDRIEKATSGLDLDSLIKAKTKEASGKRA